MFQMVAGLDKKERAWDLTHQTELNEISEPQYKVKWTILGERAVVDQIRKASATITSKPILSP